MRTRFHNHDQVSDAVHTVATREMQVLDQRLADVQEDLKSLDISIRRHLRDNTYTAKLILWVPSAEIVASGTGPRQETALRDAFVDLVDEVDIYLAKLRGEPAMRREAKFHRDKAELAREATDAGQGWPPEPPKSELEAESWVALQPPPTPSNEPQ